MSRIEYLHRYGLKWFLRVFVIGPKKRWLRERFSKPYREWRRFNKQLKPWPGRQDNIRAGIQRYFQKEKLSSWSNGFTPDLYVVD